LDKILRYILQVTNGNSHILERQDNGTYKTIGFVAGESNNTQVLNMLNKANQASGKDNA
jgi:hypothetical protein